MGASKSAFAVNKSRKLSDNGVRTVAHDPVHPRVAAGCGGSVLLLDDCTLARVATLVPRAGSRLEQ